MAKQERKAADFTRLERFLTKCRQIEAEECVRVVISALFLEDRTVRRRVGTAEIEFTLSEMN